MLTDDERAALERLRPIRAGGSVGGSYGSLGISNTVDAIRNYQRDCYTAIDLTLREHPADEGEPVTPDWLEASGFKEWSNADFIIEVGTEIRIRVNITGDAIMEQWADRGYHNGGYEWKTSKSLGEGLTRGDVYRLLGALRIEVKG